MPDDRPPFLRRLAEWPRFLTRAAPDAGALYDLRGEHAIETGGDVPVVNMGYWEGIEPGGAETIERANFALFDLVARGAELAADHEVVDAGCGFGTNAVHLVQRYGPRRVTGVNVSSVQLATARRRAAAAGLGDRVEFVHGSVTALPMEAGSVDRVVSVEAAFHFDTRDAFFAEAHRVLRPGGKLSLVDLVVTPPRNVAERAMLPTILRSQAAPRSNIYDLAEYVRRVEAAGFVIEAGESIVAKVFPAFRRWMLGNPSQLIRYDMMYILASMPYLVYPWDYARIVARKPD